MYSNSREVRVKNGDPKMVLLNTISGKKTGKGEVERNGLTVLVAAGSLLGERRGNRIFLKIIDAALHIT